MSQTMRWVAAFLVAGCAGGGDTVDWQDYGGGTVRDTSDETGRLGPTYTITGGADCDQVYDDAYDECLASGGSAVDCAAQAQQAREVCDDAGDPAVAACREQADGVYDDCVGQGGSPVDCRQIANTVFDECMGASTTP